MSISDPSGVVGKREREKRGSVLKDVERKCLKTFWSVIIYVRKTHMYTHTHTE